MWPGYGQDLMRLMASVYPGYHATASIGQVLVGTGYGLVDGGVKGALFACINLNDTELTIYNRYYEHFRAQLPTPDLVIYLQATPEVLKKRLKKKNAPDERSISDDYIEEVAKAYDHFFFHYSASDLLVVNTSDIDFVDRHEDLQELLRRLTEPIKGTQYFLPLGSSEAASA